MKKTRGQSTTWSADVTVYFEGDEILNETERKPALIRGIMHFPFSTTASLRRFPSLAIRFSLHFADSRYDTAIFTVMAYGQAERDRPFARLAHYEPDNRKYEKRSYISVLELTPRTKARCLTRLIKLRGEWFISRLLQFTRRGKVVSATKNHFYPGIAFL